MTKNERIKQLEERVAWLEQEVRTLTNALWGTAPALKLTKWKPPFVFSGGDTNIASTTSGENA